MSHLMNMLLKYNFVGDAEFFYANEDFIPVINLVESQKNESERLSLATAVKTSYFYLIIQKGGILHHSLTENHKKTADFFRLMTLLVLK